jgi:PTS system mannose-specific IID component
MQHLGVAYTLMPELRRIHSTPEALKAAVLRHLEYFNTQPYMAAPLLGAAVHLEEEIARGAKSPEEVNSFKASIMGSYGAIGDSFFWAACKPLGAELAVIMILLGAGAWGPLIFLLGFDSLALGIRSWGFFAGLKLGPMVVARLARLDFAIATRRLKIAGAMMGGILVALWSHHYRTAGTGLSTEMITFPLTVVMAGAARRGVSPAISAMIAAGGAALAQQWLVPAG